MRACAWRNPGPVSSRGTTPGLRGQVTPAGSIRAARLLLEPLDEPLEHAGPDFVLADLVLNAVLEVGVVVDLHDDEAALGLLDVDPVEAVADRARRPHRNVDQVGRRLVEVEGAPAALARGAVGAVLDDLPVAARHAVLAHEQ